ncbi:AAA family ATPase [Nesterenkonia sp. DZ6]|uniref:AAA family ATPase n=1 Tax=Nesterenkonia sp. DZ6 TaxID=2901229 RepID=UPI001F4D1D56|nr:AAA family ATPase [Nesterenkonia sp. DZ6]MCH8559240.1 AAA family ATPase [Nesterenkonia sp. DZ6]
MPFINDRLNEIKQQQMDEQLTRMEREDFLSDGIGAGSDGVDLEAIRSRLLQRIVGQNAAVEAVTRSVAVGRAGVGDRDRPLANVLLLGPTGVGKTELVRQLAASLRTGPDDLSRIDMSSLSQEHYMASLTGAPPGYAGSKESFSLFDRSKIGGDPYMPGIALFDEVEKAHRSVHRAMLQVMDHGLLKLANGQETINFRNAYVFMTSNLGSAELMERSRSRVRRTLTKAAERAGISETPLYQRLWGDDSVVVRKALESFFEPEFINRIDEVVVFNPLTDQHAVAVADLEIRDLMRRCASRGIDLKVEPQVAVFVSAQGYDQAYGGRSIKRLVREQVATPVARAALSARGVSGQKIQVSASLDGGEVVALPRVSEPVDDLEI